MILLATQVENDPGLTPFGLLNITVDRNGYGRQFDSFVDDGEFTVNGKTQKLEMVFIRAPKVLGRRRRTCARQVSQGTGDRATGKDHCDGIPSGNDEVDEVSAVFPVVAVAVGRNPAEEHPKQ
jgi:hypothetical protein